MLVPPDVPLHRTRAERFDDLVLQDVARLELGTPSGGPGGPGSWPPAPGALQPGTLEPGALEPGGDEAGPQPPRIVVYRRPLMARADGEDELGELVFDVVVEEFARILGIDPADVDPGYAGGE